MKYTDFVKANYPKVAHLPNKERMKAIAKLWKESGNAKAGAKGAGIFGDIGHAVDGVGSLFGLGLEKKKRGRPAGKKTHSDKRTVKGAGIFGDIGNGVDSIGSLFGLGLEKQKKQRGRPRKAKGGSMKEVEPEGAGIFGDIGQGVDSIGSLFGLGLEKKKGRPSKKNTHSNSELMQLIAKHRKAKGGSFNLATLLPLLAL